MTPINTSVIDFVSNSEGTNTDIFTPATGALPTANYKEILVAIWLSALTTNAQARWGIRFGNDGITWDAPAKLDIPGVSGGYATALGWTFGNAWTDITSVTGTTYKLFFQLGIMGRNKTGGGTAVESGQGRLSFQCKPVIANSLTFGPRRIWCRADGSTIFVPMSGPIPAADIGEVRGIIEMNGTTGRTSPANSRIGLTCAFQEANKPDDPSDWTGTTAFGAQALANGITFGTNGAFTPVTGVTKRHLRFGFNAVNPDVNNEAHVCQASMRIDYRR